MSASFSRADRRPARCSITIASGSMTSPSGRAMTRWSRARADLPCARDRSPGRGRWSAPTAERSLGRARNAPRCARSPERLLRDLLGLRAVLPVDDRAALARIVFVLKTGYLMARTTAGVVRVLRRDLLAAAAGLDRGRGVRRGASPAAGPVTGAGPLDLDIAEPARQHAAHPAGRRDPGDPWQTLNITASPCGTKASRRGSLEGTPTMAPAWARPDGSSNAHLPLTPTVPHGGLRCHRAFLVSVAAIVVSAHPPTRVLRNVRRRPAGTVSAKASSTGPLNWPWRSITYRRRCASWRVSVERSYLGGPAVLEHLRADGVRSSATEVVVDCGGLV